MASKENAGSFIFIFIIFVFVSFWRVWEWCILRLPFCLSNLTHCDIIYKGHNPPAWKRGGKKERKKTVLKKKTVQVGKMKKIAANCQHSNRVGERSRVKRRSCGVSLVVGQISERSLSLTVVAWLPLAPIDPSPSWAYTLPEIACVSNAASGKWLLVSCCRLARGKQKERQASGSVYTAHNRMKISESLLYSNCKIMNTIKEYTE